MRLSKSTIVIRKEEVTYIDRIYICESRNFLKEWFLAVCSIFIYKIRFYYFPTKPKK